jgi:hypothetical protein
MIKDTISSFRDNIRRRISNPLLGTFLVVYVVKNWELFYGIFNFDSNSTQINKLDFIRNYFVTINGFENLAECVGYSFVVLIGTYLLLALSRLIVDTYEDIVLPIIFSLTNKSRIVDKEVYLRVENERIEITKRYEQEREDKYRIQKERDNLDNQLLELKASDKSVAEMADLKAQIESLQSKLINKEDEVSSLQKQIVDNDAVITELKVNRERKKYKKSPKNLTETLYEEIKRNDKLEFFEYLFFISSIREKSKFTKENLDFFIKNSILTLSSASPTDGSVIITFTSLGHDIYNLRLKEKYSEKKEIYEEIIERFPVGRLAAYLLNNKEIDIKEVIEELGYFTKGADSDRRYTDEKSKRDASEFIQRLLELKQNKSNSEFIQS